MGIQSLSLETIEKLLRSNNFDISISAIELCVGRTDIPEETIEKWVEDEDCDVRKTAIIACMGRTDIPFIRTFEPNEKVYKKCVGGVIVVAEIPQTAQVRGGFDRKCRASEAIITDIIGDVEGEKIGISSYDKTTIYEIGNHITIEDFDYGNKECGTVFHFFNTLEEAKKFDFNKN